MATLVTVWSTQFRRPHPTTHRVCVVGWGRLNRWVWRAFQYPSELLLASGFFGNVGEMTFSWTIDSRRDDVVNNLVIKKNLARTQTTSWIPQRRDKELGVWRLLLPQFSFLSSSDDRKAYKLSYNAHTVIGENQISSERSCTLLCTFLFSLQAQEMLMLCVLSSKCHGKREHGLSFSFVLASEKQGKVTRKPRESGKGHVAL